MVRGQGKGSSLFSLSVGMKGVVYCVLGLDDYVGCCYYPSLEAHCNPVGFCILSLLGHWTFLTCCVSSKFSGLKKKLFCSSVHQQELLISFYAFSPTLARPPLCSWSEKCLMCLLRSARMLESGWGSVRTMYQSLFFFPRSSFACLATTKHSNQMNWSRTHAGTVGLDELKNHY